MDAINRFVCEQNVRRYREMLETELDSARQLIVTRLLVAEESKLGFTLEELGYIDRYIARCRELVAQQEVLVRRLDGDGSDTGQAGALLVALRHCLAIHLHHRGRIREELDRTDL